VGVVKFVVVCVGVVECGVWCVGCGEVCGGVWWCGGAVVSQSVSLPASAGVTRGVTWWGVVVVG